jgi:YHS domain-containing protein
MEGEALNFKRAHAALAISAVIISSSLFLLSETIQAKPANLNVDGVAIDGYDSVAYFTLGRAVKGSADHQHEWMGAKWNFSTAEHQTLFAENPEKYAPQYGGFCAFAMSKGSKAGASPVVWSIVGDRLYLNFNKQVQSIWTKNSATLTKQADNKWAQMT